LRRVNVPLQFRALRSHRRQPVQAGLTRTMAFAPAARRKVVARGRLICLLSFPASARRYDEAVRGGPPPPPPPPRAPPPPPGGLGGALAPPPRATARGPP